MSNTGALTTLLCASGLTVIVALVMLSFSIRVVQEGNRLSVYRLGRYIGEKGPGLVFLLPFIDRGIIKGSASMNNIGGSGIAGQEGETRTTVFTDGKVLVNGQEWEAVSRSPIAAGETVRVVRTILEVEKK